MMASKRRIRRKACERKQRFKSEAGARFGIAMLRKHGKATGHFNTYLCQFCGGFHFGHSGRD